MWAMFLWFLLITATSKTWNCFRMTLSDNSWLTAKEVFFWFLVSWEHPSGLLGTSWEHPRGLLGASLGSCLEAPGAPPGAGL